MAWVELKRYVAHMGKYDDLLYYAQAYLQLAKLGCQELLGPNHNKTEEIPDWKMDYTVQIVGPIIYNTKHGIECFLKVLQQIAGENYDMASTPFLRHIARR